MCYFPPESTSHIILWFNPHFLFCTCIGRDGPKTDFLNRKTPFSLSMHWLRKWRSGAIICFTSVCFLLMWSRRFFLLTSIPQWIYFTLICFKPVWIWCEQDMCGSLGEGWGWSKGDVWADTECRGVKVIKGDWSGGPLNNFGWYTGVLGVGDTDVCGSLGSRFKVSLFVT